MRRPLLLIHLIFCVSMFMPVLSHGWENRETIRIAIIRDDAVSVGTTGGTVYGHKGSTKSPVKAGAAVELKGGKDGVQLNGKAYESVSVEPGERGITVNGKEYRGMIYVYGEEDYLVVVNELFLEDYLVGLINKEISSSWPLESVKAQAVAARSYALFQKRQRKGQLYDLESSVISQVYGGKEGEDDVALHAVKETDGIVALYNGEVIQAVFHSACGGLTEGAKEMWGKDIPYLRKVNDPYCTEAPNFFWQFNADLTELGEVLKESFPETGEVKSLTVKERSESGRVLKVSIRHSGGEYDVSGKDLRDVIGMGNLRSTAFIIKMKPDAAYFAGTGNGHGVGMCQWGAKGMADNGKGYKEILLWYYPGITIGRLN